MTMKYPSHNPIIHFEVTILDKYYIDEEEVLDKLDKAFTRPKGSKLFDVVIAVQFKESI